jgi:type II secretory pathway component PulF
MLPNHPLDYDSSPPQRGRRFSPAAFLWMLMVMLLITIILTLILPRVETIYKDFGVKLPAVTIAVLSAGHSIGGVASWIVAIPLSVLAAYVVATLPIRGRRLQLILTLFLGVIACLIALALFLPMISLMQNAYDPSAKP